MRRHGVAALSPPSVIRLGIHFWYAMLITKMVGGVDDAKGWVCRARLKFR